MAVHKLKIGFFGGSFDPIHYGHINLAFNALEKKELDQIWFSPAWKNPLKTTVNFTEAHHRLNMLRLALQDIAFFRVLEQESSQNKLSYTVDALKNLLINPPIHEPFELYLLLGADAAGSFFDWNEPREIVKLTPLIIGSRSAEPIDLGSQRDLDVIKAIEAGQLQMPLLDISSTEIRQRIREGRYSEYLLPKSVIEYARKHKLYELDKVN